FSVLLWLGLNTLSRERLPWLAWGIHGGAVVASVWAALQFWVNFNVFPQGPHPASTFVNRNFFAEFAVCTLPFGAVLLARARQSGPAALMAASSGLIIVAILMTGTRAALVALWLQLLLVLPFMAWLYRAHFAFGEWSRGMKLLIPAVLIATVGGLGMIVTGDPQIVQEERGITALERGFKRTGSISAQDPSLGIRMIMWKATARVIEQRPLSGVGAGAWENDVPLYQEAGSQLETDYYVHNEYLQLVAEYGLVGWAFLLALAAYLLSAAARTLLGKTPQERAEAPWRAVLLCSLLALLIVSGIGFAWRMATTGALFALCLAGLAASDARLGWGRWWEARRIPWRPAFSGVASACAVASLALALYITQLAAECEQKIVKATRLALAISHSGQPNHPRWDKPKQEMLRLIREGVAINPHYRKITPMVADELARWGDWKNAVWIWESVLSSRPHVVAIISNVARGYTSMGEPQKALDWLEKARRVQPRAPAVRSLEVILLSRTGQDARALELAREAIHSRQIDYDLVNATFSIAARAGDFPLAAEAMRLRMAGWPATRAFGFIQLGNMYAAGVKDPEKALQAFRTGWDAATEAQRGQMIHQIPPAYRERLKLVAPPTPQAPASAQTSASKG
ncbi:MAG TPA: O-antigen ligase family protein, partial [Ramlibacter sp.]|nr:O-antigen ligase family protein [Ramlibacter sp.]